LRLYLQLLQYSHFIRAIDTGTDCSVLSTVQRGNGGYYCSYCSSVTSQALDTGTDCIVVNTLGGGGMAVMPAVTAVLLNHSAMCTGTDCSVVVTV